jgi:hypothetical protein
LVDAAAFLTRLSTDLRWTANTGWKVTVSDGTNSAYFFAGAAGTGETLDVDLMSGFNFTSGWSSAGGGSPSDADTFATSAVGGIYKSSGIFTASKLYKVAYATDNANSVLRICGIGAIALPGLADLVSGSNYHTGNTTYAGIYLRNSTASTTNVSVLTAQQVLTPDSTGLQALKTAGGAAGWASTGTFNPNAAAYNITITKD